MKAGSKRLHQYALQLGYEFLGVDGSGHLIYRHDHTRNEVRITSGCYEGPAFKAYRSSLETGAGFHLAGRESDSHGPQGPQNRRRGPKRRKGDLAAQHAARKAERDREAILARKLAAEAARTTPTPAKPATEDRDRRLADEQRRLLASYAVATRYDELQAMRQLMH